MILGLNLFHSLGVDFELSVPGDDLVLEYRDNGDGLLEELVLEEFGFEARLSLAEVLDEAEEVGDVVGGTGTGLNLSGGAREERAREWGLVRG